MQPPPDVLEGREDYKGNPLIDRLQLFLDPLQARHRRHIVTSVMPKSAQTVTLGVALLS